MEFRQGGYVESFEPQTRSVYVMSADARHCAQHRMPDKKTPGIRYSITFRHVPHGKATLSRPASSSRSDR